VGRLKKERMFWKGNRGGKEINKIYFQGGLEVSWGGKGGSLGIAVQKNKSILMWGEKIQRPLGKKKKII